MFKSIFIAFFVCFITSESFAQFDCNKNGEITFGKKVIADIDNVKHFIKLILINKITNDTVIEFNLNGSTTGNGSFGDFNFKKENKNFKVSTNGVFTSLRPKRDLAKFILTHNLLTDSGTINLESLKKFEDLNANLYADFNEIKQEQKDAETLKQNYFDKVAPKVNNEGIATNAKDDVIFILDVIGADEAIIKVNVYDRNRTKLVAIVNINPTLTTIKTNEDYVTNNLPCVNYFTMRTKEIKFSRAKNLQCIVNYLVLNKY